MRNNRWRSVVVGATAAVMLFQATPGGMLTAYAAEHGITVEPRTDELKAELAAKAGDYPAGAFAFYDQETALKEGEGDREVKIVRWGDTSAKATVDVKVFALTATYGEDFEVYTTRGLAKDVLDEQAAPAQESKNESKDAKDGSADKEGAAPGKATDLDESAAQDADASKGNDEDQSKEPEAAKPKDASKDDASAAESQDADDPEQEPAEEKVPFTAAPAEQEPEAAAESNEDAVAAAETDEQGDDISSMRESYAIQTGNDTKRTNWRGEYEESLAPVLAVEAANQIANELPGAAGTLTFEPGEYVKTVHISVKDDALAESKEAFKLMLGNASVGVLGEQMQHTVSIEDNEQGEKIAFAMKDAEVTVAPDAEYAELTVLRTSGKDYYAGAVVDTAADTAGPETSYEAMDGVTVPFASGSTEQVVRVPLKDGAEPGTQFTVRLNATANNVDGIAETVVKIEGDTKDEPAESDVAKNEDAAVAPAPAAEPAAAQDSDSERISDAPRYEHNGVVYDGTTVEPKWVAEADGADVTDGFTYTKTDLSKEATRIIADIDVWGSTGYSIFGTSPFKNWSMDFGGRNLIDRRDCDQVSTKNYVEQFNFSYNEGKNGGLHLSVNTDGINYDGRIRLNKITYYYPRYTVVMDDADYEQKLKGRNYTSTKDYTEFEVDALTKDFKDKTETVAHGGTVSLIPISEMNSDVYVEKYEIYCGNEKIGENDSSLLDYSDLNELRKNHEDTLSDNKFKVRIKPVYQGLPVLARFESQDASAIAFSGDKPGGKGFKVGDKLLATQIDTVDMTIECPTDQKIKPHAISRFEMRTASNPFSNRWTHTKDYFAQDGLSLTVKDVPLGSALDVKFKAMHEDATLTYEYTPSETGAANAGAGAVVVYDTDDLSKPVGVTNYQTPLSLQKSLEMIAGNSYVARVLKGDGFQEGTIVDGIPYSTRTIWTYNDSATGRRVSTTGNSLVFDPYYADEVVNYHFKSVQDDAQKAGVTGTVYIQEKPLFSQNANLTSKPAVGVELDVGGENAKTDQNGAYRIEPTFNKSDYVSAFLTYDSLTLMSNVAISQDTVKDFYIDVAENDGLKVTGSSIFKLTDTHENDMNNEDILEQREVSSVLVEDATYTFKVNALGSAGVTPGKAEFYFYDKNGNRLDDKTQTATFDGNVVSMSLNPSKLNLEVGTSMTVKLFDTDGKGYFEHQTSVILGKKATGMYTFNYEGIKREDDNLFLKALGGLSMGFDFILDAALSSNAGTYEGESGEQHQLMCLGLGDGFQNKGPNTEREVYNTLQEAIADIENVNTGDYKLSANDSLAFFGSGSWSFNISLGVIYDMVMEDSGSRKGEFKFNDYLVLVNASSSYNKEWKVPFGPAKLTFKLQFGFGDPGNGTSGASVKWHFYDPDEQGYFVDDNSVIELLTDPNVDNEGYFGLDARVMGALRTEFLGELIGGEGELTVQVGNRIGYDSEKWNDYGEVLLSPKAKLVVLGVAIPIWTHTWRHEWEWNEKGATAEASAAMMDAINEGMSPEKVLFASTDQGTTDYSYANQRSGWNSGSGFSLFGASKAAENVDEQALQKGFLTDSDISVYNLGGGKYIAAFLDVVPGRDDANKMGAYYSVFDGTTWSTPVLLKDDGTQDQVPTISDAGDKGVLIAWSSAGEKLNGDADLGSQLNQFNIQGAFYKDGKLDDVMQITTSTDQDYYADTNPRAVCYQAADGSQRIKLYYTKSEFKVSDKKEGEVVGDLLNPDQLNLVREYDVEKGAWVDTYDAATEQGIREKLKADLIAGGIKDPTLEQIDAAYKEYCENWYGQVFLDLAPAVDIAEQLDEDGRWVEGTTPTITELDAGVASDRMVKESDAIAYNGLGLLAYSLDKGGMAQATGDQNLYLQIFNADSGEYHHPVMISGTNAEISDIQFVRSTYKGADGAPHGLTWLYWKEQASVAKKDETGSPVTDENGNPVLVETTSIKRIDISTLVGAKTPEGEMANLVQGVTESGKKFYYINKSADNELFTPEQVLVSSTPEAEEGEDLLTIGDFQVRSSADGRYNFIAWTQPVTAGEGDHTRQELQLFVIREDMHTGEISSPVQLTDKADQYIAEFDFAVTDDGNIDVLAGRQTLKEQPVFDENGDDTGVVAYEPDAKTSELVSMRITPSDEMSIDDAVEGSLHKDGDEVVVDLSTTLLNESFDAVEKINVVAVDTNGKTVYSSKDEELGVYENTAPVEGADGGVTFEGGSDLTAKRGLITLGGGEAYDLTLRVPVSKEGIYDMTLKVMSGDREVATKQLKGQMPVRLSSTELSADVAERDRVELSATVSNETALSSGERNVAYGYIDADGKQVELGTTKIANLKPGEKTEFSVTIDQDFATFESAKREDGSQVDSRKYYLDLEPAGKRAKDEEGAADVGVIDEGDNSATIVFDTLELTANAGQVTLMGKANKLGVALTADDGEGGIKKIDGVKPGEYADLALTIDGELAQHSEEFINGFKVVWDEVDTDVATVDANGLLLAKKKGSVTLTGKVMPANTETVVAEGGAFGEIDNYDTLPASLIKPIKVTLDLGTGGSTGGGSGDTDGDGNGGDDSGDAGSGNTGGTGGAGGAGSNGSGSTANGKLPSTGDMLSPVFLIVVTTAGAALVVTGTHMRRRANKKGR